MQISDTYPLTLTRLHPHCPIDRVFFTPQIKKPKRVNFFPRVHSNSRLRNSTHTRFATLHYSCPRTLSLDHSLSTSLSLSRLSPNIIHKRMEMNTKFIMEDCIENIINFVKKPAIMETFVDILICSVPLWVAAVIGLVIGWSWRPRWTSLVYLGLRPKLRLFWAFPLGFGARRLWIAFTALSAFSLASSRLCSNFRGRTRKDSVGDSARSGETIGGNIR